MVLRMTDVIPNGLLGNPLAGVANRPARIDHVHSPLGMYCRLGFIVAANMNIATDQLPTKTIDYDAYLVDTVRTFDASVSLTTAVGGIYTLAAKTGVIVVAAAQAYAALTTNALGLDLTIAAAGKDKLFDDMILSLTTPQGGAGTLAFEFWGIPYTFN